MSLRKIVSDIEEDFFKNNVYIYCKEIMAYYKMRDALNEIIGGIDGKIYDFYQDYSSGKKIFGLLNEENKKKYVKTKYEMGTSLEKKTKGLIAKIRFYLRGNTDENKIDCLLISTNHPDRKKYIRLLLGRDGAFPKRLLMTPFFRLMYRCQVLDIADELEKRGIILDEHGFSRFGVNYAVINRDYKIYEKCREQGKKKIESLKRLFGDYFSIRDFRNAKIWLDKLTEILPDNEAQEYIKMWKKLEEAFISAEKSIKSHEHIVMTWIDALRYDELHNMPKMEKRMRGGLFYERMYTETPYTSATTKSIFTGKHYIEDKHYIFSAAKFEHSTLKQILDKNEMTLFSFSEVIVRNWHPNKYVDEVREIYDGIPFSLYLFLCTCTMEEEQKGFSIVHEVMSVHAPRWSPKYPEGIEGLELPEDREAVMKQIFAGEEYVDEELEWYDRFLECAKYHIYMSDHGQPRWERQYTVEGLHHVVFSITGGGISQRIVSAVGTLMNMPQIVNALLEGRIDKLEEVSTAEYMLIENDDPYGRRIDEITERYDKGEPQAIDQWLQYRGIVTQNDTYVLHATGKEYYFQNGNESENCVSKSNCTERIEYLRKLCGENFIDIYDEPKYRPSVKIYEHLGLKIEKKFRKH